LFATVIGHDALASPPTWRLHGRARTTRLDRPRHAPHVDRPMSASTAPRLTFVTFASAPLHRGGMQMRIADFGKKESKLFSRQNLERFNRLERLR
jgi:hypothetical protein